MIDWEAAFKQLAGYYYSIMEGDTHRIGDAFKLMREYGVVDEDGYPIDDE